MSPRSSFCPTSHSPKSSYGVFIMAITVLLLDAGWGVYATPANAVAIRFLWLHSMMLVFTWWCVSCPASTLQVAGLQPQPNLQPGQLWSLAASMYLQHQLYDCMIVEHCVTYKKINIVFNFFSQIILYLIYYIIYHFSNYAI